MPPRSDQQKKTPTQSSWAKIVGSVSDPIRLFALGLLVIESIFSLVYLSKDRTDSIKTYYPWGTLLLMLIVIILIFILALRKKETPATLTLPTRPIEGIDDFLNQILFVDARINTKNLLEKIKNLPSIDHPLFRKAINLDYSEFMMEVENWSKSCVIIDGPDNDDFLFELYSKADRNVFSTCIRDYIESWDGEFGKKLLKAHEENPSNASVNRIFIFEAISDVSAKYIEIMKNHNKHGVKVLVYIDAWHEDFDFQSQQLKDFTIVDDGDVIGETSLMKYGERQTCWTFKNNNKYAIVKDTYDKLSHRADKLGEFLPKLNNA
ncbi:MAG TPA: hypothetical protein VKR32_12075 [Puia sp.]|nr:hypothetical protein [Puia sp.]